ncbi:ankyrin [Auricularia subglabra TFB-10046 SS5]|nr:ankyrin [Auricularia subglabra TFB-10046 SS5]
MPAPPENIWIAASDGDLAAVTAFVDSGVSPNAHDPNSYTPMHAAASYGHTDILEYLIQKGACGNVNITDDDGDTPLFTVESVELAQWLVAHGADHRHRNAEGLRPADHLAEDFPVVANYLLSLEGPNAPPLAPLPQSQPTNEQEQHFAGQVSEELTRSLIQRAQALRDAHPEMDDAEIERELVQLVGRTVLEGVTEGAAWAVDRDDADDAPGHPPPQTNGDGPDKRRRLD